jgi:hypothetical protein
MPQNWTPDAIIPNATTDTQGAFEVLGVVPGSYVLYASAGALTGRLPIDVGNADLEKLKVTLAPGVEVTGRVTIDGSSENLQLSALRVSLIRDPDLLGLPQGRGGPNGFAVAADGSFRVPGVSVGDYRLSIAGLPRGAYIEAAQADQEDLLATGIHVDTSAVRPIQVRLGTESGKVEGSVVNERRESISNAIVVLAPETTLRRQKSLFKAVATDVLGRFTIEDVPPGNYKLFGWDHVTEGAWENEAFLKTVEARGRNIRVTAKSTATLEGLSILR